MTTSSLVGMKANQRSLPLAIEQSQSLRRKSQKVSGTHGRPTIGRGWGHRSPVGSRHLLPQPGIPTLLPQSRFLRTPSPTKRARQRLPDSCVVFCT